jgi:hypothetical protein
MRLYQIYRTGCTTLALGHDGENYFLISHIPATPCFEIQTATEQKMTFEEYNWYNRRMTPYYQDYDKTPIVSMASGDIWQRHSIGYDVAYIEQQFRYEDKILYSVNPNLGKGIVALFNDELTGFKSIYTYCRRTLILGNILIENDFRIKTLDNGFRLDPLGRINTGYVNMRPRFHSSDTHLACYQSNQINILKWTASSSVNLRDESLDKEDFGVVRNVCFSPSGKQYLILCKSHVLIRETETGKELSSMFVPSKSLKHCCWSLDGMTYAVADQKKQVFVYDAPD